MILNKYFLEKNKNHFKRLYLLINTCFNIVKHNIYRKTTTSIHLRGWYSFIIVTCICTIAKSNWYSIMQLTSRKYICVTRQTTVYSFFLQKDAAPSINCDIRTVAHIRSISVASTSALRCCFKLGHTLQASRTSLFLSHTQHTESKINLRKCNKIKMMSFVGRSSWFKIT